MTVSGGEGVSEFSFATVLASPPAIGGTTPEAGTFTDLTVTGDISMAGIPAFLVQATASQNNVAGSSAPYQITFDTEVFDQGGDFASNVFTAPNTGRYQINWSVDLLGMTAACDLIELRVVTSNRTITYSFNKTNDVPDNYTFDGGMLFDMDASDTARLQIRATGEASDVIDVGQTNTYFSGYQVA